jgi:hypothetical protein
MEEISEFFFYGLRLSNPNTAVDVARKEADSVAKQIIVDADKNKDGVLSLKEVQAICATNDDYKYIFLSFSVGIASVLGNIQFNSSNS